MKKKFRGLEKHFINFGSSLKAPKKLPKPVIADENNEINVNFLPKTT